VASIYSVGLSHMSRLVQVFLRRFPKANVRLQYQHPDRVYQMVHDNRVDLGLVSYPRGSRTIKAIPWRSEQMVFVCAPEHALAGRPSVRLEELEGLDLVSFDERLRIREEIDRTLAGHGVNVKVVMEFDNIETLKRAVEINAGVSLLPAPTVVREVDAQSLVSVPLEGIDMVRPLGIICRRGAELGKTALRFIRLLREESVPETDGRSDLPSIAEPPPADRHVKSGIRGRQHSRKQSEAGESPSSREE